MLLAPTSMAEKKDRTAIRYALHIPAGCFKKHLPALNDKVRSSLRNTFSKVKAIVIDERSMASNDLLFCIHLRVLKLFLAAQGIPILQVFASFHWGTF